MAHTQNPVISGTVDFCIPQTQSFLERTPDLFHTTNRGTQVVSRHPKPDLFPTTKRRPQVVLRHPKPDLFNTTKRGMQFLSHHPKPDLFPTMKLGWVGRKRVSRHPKPDLFHITKRGRQACVTSPKTRLVAHHEVTDLLPTTKRGTQACVYSHPKPDVGFQTPRRGPALPGNGGEPCCRAALAAWSTRVNTDLGQHANGRIHTRSECRDMFCSQIWDVVLGDASVVSERSY